MRIDNSYEIRLSELLTLGRNYARNMQFSTVAAEPSLTSQYCMGSSLYRGYYHPSPVYDLLVGNVKRGRLVKNIHGSLAPCHHYLFDKDGRLRAIENFYNGCVTHVERLLYLENQRIGINISCHGILNTVTREVYDGERLMCLAIAHCEQIRDYHYCFDYLEEHYHYDEEGLCACDFVAYSPQSGYTMESEFHFERSGGYIVSYYDALTANPLRYKVRKKRRA